MTPTRILYTLPAETDDTAPMSAWIGALSAACAPTRRLSHFSNEDITLAQMQGGGAGRRAMRLLAMFRKARANG